MRPGRLTVAAFYGCVLIGGFNFVAVKFSNEELPPLYGASLRFAVAALIFFGIAAVKRMQLPKGRALWGALVYGLLSFGVSYALLYISLTKLAAGTVSVILAMVPIVTLTLAVLHGQERFTSRGLIGGVLVIAGIAVLSLRSVGGSLPLTYLFLAIGGALSTSEASVLIKSFPRADPITTNAVGMSMGAIALALGSLATGERWIVPTTAQTWLVLGWLIVAGSVGLFALFIFVIKRWTASASVYALTLMPLVAVTTGALLADEEIRPELIAGGVLVILGVYIGALSAQRVRRSGEIQVSSPEQDVAKRLAEGCTGTGVLPVEDSTQETRGETARPSATSP